MAPPCMPAVARKRRRTAVSVVESEARDAVAGPAGSPDRRGGQCHEMFDRWDALVEREQSDAYVVNRLVTPQDAWRRAHRQFSLELCDQYDFDRWIVSAAFGLFDRLFSRGHVRSGEWSLALMTCLYIAIKICSSHEGKMLDMEEILYICKRTFVADEIVNMEEGICRALGWHMNPPIPEAFIGTMESLLMEAEGIAEIVPAEMRTELVKQSKLLCELSVVDRNYVGVKPSSIAFAAVLVALDLMQFPGRAIQWFESLPLEHDAEETNIYAQHLHVLCEEEGYQPDKMFLDSTNGEASGDEAGEKAIEGPDRDSPADVKENLCNELPAGQKSVAMLSKGTTVRVYTTSL